MLLGWACVPFLFPFIILNIYQDKPDVAVLAALLLIIAVLNSVMILKTKREIIPYSGVFIIKLSILLYLIPTIGPQGLFWCYPVMLAVYFCDRRFNARVMSVIALLTLIPTAYYFLEVGIVLRFGVTLFLLCMFSDLLVGVIFNLQTRMADLIIRDPLTNAYNRRHMSTCLKNAIEECKRGFGAVSLVMLDIDYFKKVNDTHGHDAGDRVLNFLVNLLHRRQRKTDYVFRTGGEEFVILLRHTNQEQAATMAENLRENVETTPTVSAGGSITVSLGVAEYRDNEDIDSWLKRVDENLYKAKQLGRNRVYPSIQDTELLNTSNH